MTSIKEFDVLIYGASGFTGRLVAEHFAQHYGSKLAWGLAGRDLDRLAAVREEIGAPADVPLVVADADNLPTLSALSARTRMVITTVGPYQLYGSALVAACVQGGIDYLDLSGETAWMRAMIDAHEAEAKASGARILFSCGFDSVPSELGVLVLQDAARVTFGCPAVQVKGRIRRIQGGLSGGTVASLRAAAVPAAHDPGVLALPGDPFCLAPGFQGPAQPSGTHAAYDTDVDAWIAPFIMAPINTSNVHRSNLLQHHAYGTDFLYDEMLVTGSGDQGKAIAQAIASDPLSFGSDAARQPGEGPSRAEQEAGSYDILFIGVNKDGRQIRVSVSGDRDPGYGSTSKIIAETAVLLGESTNVLGGVWTPGAALGRDLANRLVARAGLTFAVEVVQ